MQTYRLEAQDGIEHIIRIVGEEEEQYDVLTTHRFHGYEIETERYYNKCVFEKLLSLGIIIPLLDI